MENKNIGSIISTLRKEKNMTQSELANKMNVTDKAVSKWERNISCPDINSIPKLAEILDVSVEEVLNAKGKNNNTNINNIIDLVLICVALAMGVCIIVTSILNSIEVKNAFILLGIAITAIALYLLRKKDKEK